jgi:hypothetical protein
MRISRDVYTFEVKLADVTVSDDGRSPALSFVQEQDYAI